MDVLEKNKRVLGGITQLLTTSLHYSLLFKSICYIRKKLYVASIDFKKAFDLATYAKLWPILLNHGFSSKMYFAIQSIIVL